MKKLLGLILFFSIFLTGCWTTYQYYYGGETYYTKIVDSGQKGSDKSDKGETFTTFTYEQPAFNDDGDAKQVTLHEYREKPLKLNAYLKMKVNKRKGVISWEEVKEGSIPEQALAQLQE